MNVIQTAGGGIPRQQCEKGKPIAKAFLTFLLLLSFIAAPVFNYSAYAQQEAGGKTVTGTVRNEAGEPLSGVSVSVKGTQQGTTTNATGQYTLRVPSSNTVLRFSSVGFAAQELTVGIQSVLDLSLKSQAGTMNEVVVVGYGTRKRATMTGSVASVDAKTFQDRGPLSNPMAALQGQVAGVTVTRSSAQPGREGWDFQVRGVTSVNGTEPLVIVDGLPVPSLSALSSFNPNDIENISFLKDASAAIYGARAAGGVVLITTKKARSGKTVVEYNGSVSRKKVGLQPQLVDINAWGPMIKEAREADGFGATDVWVNLANASIWAKQNGWDWMTKRQYDSLGYTGFNDVKDFTFFNGTMQDVLWDNATSTEHQLSLAGKGDKLGYRISLGYLDDGSLLQWGNNSNRRYNARLVNDYQVSSKLKIETNLSLEKQDITQPTGIGNILNNGIQPGLPLAAQNGKPYLWGSGLGNATVNNIAEYGGDTKENNTRINTNLGATYSILKNLRAVGNVGYYFHNTDYRTQEKIITFYDYSGTQTIANLTATNASRSAYQRVARREAYYNASGYVEYNKMFGGAHDVRAMAGAQYERNENNRILARTLDAWSAPSSLNLGTGDATSKTVTEAQSHYALGGYFSRINYAFKNKYLLEANLRYDGSSKFRAEDRWKLFYGLSAGWRILQEKFMEDVDFLNELKLRASYGTVGNQSGIGLYDYIQLLDLNFSTGPGSSGFPILGSAPAVRVSPSGLVAFDRTWEEVKTLNGGLDFGLLTNRLSGSFDYFIRRNENMLIARTLPAVLGASAPAANSGELKTWGWEAMLNWRDRIGDLTYHIGGNISDSKNELVNFGGQTLIASANQGFNNAVEGYPIGSYFGLVYEGRIQDQRQLDEYRKLATGSNVLPQGTGRNTGLQLGDNMFKDVNGDGKISFPEDAVFQGTDNPRYTYSFNGGLEWKGFDLNAIFQGVGERTIARAGNWRIPAAVVFQAQNAAFLNQWWTPERTDAFYPRISTTGTINNYNYYPSDWVVENGAYLRLKNLVVGYTLPTELTQRAKIQRLRVYFSGNDLWEKSNIRDGWDPETPRTVSNSGDADNNNISTFSQRFPFYRFLTFGVNVTF